jgi:hypothetical protein
MRHSLIKQQFNTRNQRGMTFIGGLIIIGLLVVIAIVGMKLMPAYIEFMAVKKVIRAIGQENLSEMSKKDIVDSFNKRSRIDDIKSVVGQDLIVEKDETGNTVVSVEYQVIKPVMGNVSAMMDFKASSEDK